MPDIIREVPIALFTETPLTERGGEIWQLAPFGADRRPACGKFHLTCDPLASLKNQEGDFLNWMGNQNKTTARRFGTQLANIGQSMLAGDLADMLQLREATSAKPPDRLLIRVLMYTDEEAGRLPVEAIYRSFDNGNELLGGGPLGFLGINQTRNISIVHQLGLEPLASIELKKAEPLRMLVVFSNPVDAQTKLGQVTENGKLLTFDGALQNERDALEAALGELCRLDLLKIDFLVGDGDRPNGTVYAGEVCSLADQPNLAWQIKTPLTGETASLADELVTKLKPHEASAPYHMLHWFGHGVETENGSGLFTTPGDVLTPADINFTPTPPITVLAGCHTAVPFGNAAGQPVRSFASVLLSRGTAVLVAMQTYVTPETATATTKAVYEALVSDLFSDPLAIEWALLNLRRDLFATRNLDFFVPRLYVRSVAGPLFDYADDRRAIWKSITTGGLPRSPFKLRKILQWTKTMLAGLSQNKSGSSV